MRLTTAFHNEAMDLAESAILERARGNIEESVRLFRQALDCELRAVESLDEQVEPTYSVLHRSAASLALNSNQPRKAEQIVAKALAGEPHPEIAEELRDIWEQINFHRHLELRGVELGEEEMQLSLAGAEVGFGYVQAREFQKRADDASRLIYRIAERRSNKAFRERGRLDRIIQANFEPYYSVPRAASFAVTLRFGRPAKQLPFPGILDSTIVTTSEILDELLDLMELVQSAQIAELRQRIPQPAYLRNFLSLARNLAPDGQRIRQVGLTTTIGSRTRSVAVVTPASELPAPTVVEESSAETEPVEIAGTLLFADEIRKNQIKIIDSSERSHSVDVPDGMMRDIVRPMWGANVTIFGVRRKKSIILQQIQPAD